MEQGNVVALGGREVDIAIGRVAFVTTTTDVSRYKRVTFWGLSLKTGSCNKYQDFEADREA